MYGLATVLSAGLLWAFLRAVRRGEFRMWVLYGALTALGLYVHYYTGLVVLALHLWLSLNWSRARRVLLPLLLSDAGAVLVFIPHLAQFVAEAGEFLGSARWRVAPSPVEPIRSLYYLLFGHVLPLWTVPLGLFLTVALFAIEMVSSLRRKSALRRLLLTVVLCPIAIVLAISLLVTPIYVERSFAVLTPALILLLARCAACATRPSPAPYLGVVLACLMTMGALLFHARADPAKPPLREAIEMVSKEARTTDLILHLQDASYVPALYYQPAGAGVLVDAGQRLWLASGTYPLFRGRTVESEDLALTGRAWVVTMPRYSGTDVDDLVQRWDSDHTIVETRHLESVQVRLYEVGEGQ
jgi:4-amino-4-deoxy-L-arabinose transferase-like glycosyltransferase